MIIYSVEISLNKNIHEKWLKWMKEKHISDVMGTDLFIEFSFFKNLLTDEEITYTVQYKLKNIEDYQKYQDEFAEKLQKEHNVKFRNQFSAKRKLLKYISQ
tara:strand:- start:237 stop:539 length:303 start_codon:yes stop_codon:yes gene_type:complete